MNPFLAYLRRHAVLLIIVTLLLMIGIGYQLGYRAGPSFTFVRAGSLVIKNIPVGGTVYADQTRRAVSKGTDTRILLVPGDHSIIVDVKGENPWSDVIHVDARADTVITPIFVPSVVTRIEINASQAAQVDAVFKGYALADAAHPLLMEHGCAEVSVSNNRIVASAATTTGCTPPPYLCVGGTCATTVVFAPVAPIHTVIPYPGRQDAVIVGFGNTLAVLELNPLKPQFYAPLVVGFEPLALPLDATHIVVRDSKHQFAIGF